MTSFAFKATVVDRCIHPDPQKEDTMPTAAALSCSICQSQNQDDLNQCSTCNELICGDCPASACSCPGISGIHNDLKSELRTESLKLGRLKAAGRERILSEYESTQVKLLSHHIGILTAEIIALEDMLGKQAA